jgi:hypothetical protein
MFGASAAYVPGPDLEPPLHRAPAGNEARMTIRSLLVGTLLILGAPAGAGDTLAMHVSPSMAYEPATLAIRLSIEPDSNNRILLVVADSGDFYRSSEIQLDGERAPRTNAIWYRSVPAGDYAVQGVLIGADGRTRATVRHAVTIIGSGLRE